MGEIQKMGNQKKLVKNHKMGEIQKIGFENTTKNRLKFRKMKSLPLRNASVFVKLNTYKFMVGITGGLFQASKDS